MLTINHADTASVSIGKTGKSVTVDFAKMPEASLSYIFEYGYRQILNDARASAKDEAEAVALVEKRLANLMSGTLRASPVREGNPVKRRAMELAEAKVKVNPAFIAWAQKAGIKTTSKDAVKKMRELAAAAIAVEGNQFVERAKADVAAAKELGDIEIEL